MRVMKDGQAACWIVSLRGIGVVHLTLVAWNTRGANASGENECSLFSRFGKELWQVAWRCARRLQPAVSAGRRFIRGRGPRFGKARGGSYISASNPSLQWIAFGAR